MWRFKKQSQYYHCDKALAGTDCITNMLYFSYQLPTVPSCSSRGVMGYTHPSGVGRLVCMWSSSVLSRIVATD